MKNSPSASDAADDHASADEQHRRLREQRQEREHRHVDRALPVRRHRAGGTRVSERVARTRLALALLLRERLDDVDADDVLLGDGGDVGRVFCWTSRSTGCETWL